MKKNEDGSIEAPENYQQMLTPRPLPEAQAALDAFHKELYELRNKHGISNLSFIAEVWIKAENDEQQNGPAYINGHMGDAFHHEKMAAMSLGYAQANRQMVIADCLRRYGALQKTKIRGE